MKYAKSRPMDPRRPENAEEILAEKHDLSDTEFLVDDYGYLTALFRVGLSGHLDYVDRNLIEKCPCFEVIKSPSKRLDRIRRMTVYVLEQYNILRKNSRERKSISGHPPELDEKFTD